MKLNRREAIAGLASLVASPALAQTIDVYVAEGDSITTTDGKAAKWPTYPVLYEKNAQPAVKLFDIAGSSQDSSSWRARKPESYKGAGRNSMSLLPGNDIAWKYGNSGGTRDSYLGVLATYLDARRAAGLKVVLCSTLPRASNEFNAERKIANEICAGWVGKHCDYFCDFAADPVMGHDRAPANSRLYFDGTHPTAFGQTRLEEIIRPILNAV